VTGGKPGSAPTNGTFSGSVPGASTASTRHFTLAVSTYDIFEGTEQIQQLVISRAISGLRIE
jgi:hypothetical protein